MRPASAVERANFEFFDEAYDLSLVSYAAKLLVSYDQLSKARRNLSMLRALPCFGDRLSVLDYGFGHGTLLLRLPRRHRLYGVELSAHARLNLERASSALGRKITLYSPTDLEDVRAGSFDCICCSHVLEHVRDDEWLVRRFRELLRDPGYLLVNVPINEVWDDPNHVRHYDLETVQTLLGRCGFKSLRVSMVDRWTAAILEQERVARRVPRVVLRAFRMGMALAPQRIVEKSEALLPARYSFQQLVVLAKTV